MNLFRKRIKHMQTHERASKNEPWARAVFLQGAFPLPTLAGAVTPVHLIVEISIVDENGMTSSV